MEKYQSQKQTTSRRPEPISRTSNKLDHDPHAFENLNAEQAWKCLKRLAEEVDWKWFQLKLEGFGSPPYTLTEGSRAGPEVNNFKSWMRASWIAVYTFYQDYMTAPEPIPMRLEEARKTICTMVLLCTGWDNHREYANKRQNEILEVICSDKDFLKYVREWCEKRNEKYGVLTERDLEHVYRGFELRPMSWRADMQQRPEMYSSGRGSRLPSSRSQQHCQHH